MVTILKRPRVEPYVIGNMPFPSLSPENWFMYETPEETSRRNSGIRRFVDTATRIVEEVRRGWPVTKSDIFTMVEVAIEYGDNLPMVLANMRQDKVNNFERIIRTYGLVSKDARMPHTVTLTIAAVMFPVVTCMYVHYFALQTIVPYGHMCILSPGYPRVMMTAAFAYLVPKLKDQFCIDLLHAHLLYMFQVELALAEPNLLYERNNLTDATAQILIQHAIKCVKGAVIRSRVTSTEKYKFLCTYELVKVVDGRITAVKNVTEAASAWNNLVSKYNAQV